ncbi:MAG: DUF4145 domain-containing protein [Phycisphaerales bacterium JB058]
MADWDTKEGPSQRYCCGYCNNVVASDKGWPFRSNGTGIFIRICPNCRCPTYFYGGKQSPKPKPGESIDNLPTSIKKLYEEVRSSIQADAPTCAMMGARKLLMNVAVDRNAKPGESFLTYIDFLEQNGDIPPKCKTWVDHIRKQGNIATHQIPDVSDESMLEMLDFINMLLRIVYDFPARLIR